MEIAVVDFLTKVAKERKNEDVFFVLNGGGSFESKLKTFVGNIHNDRVSLKYSLTNFLIMGGNVWGRKGNVKLRGADGDTSLFDGI
jgi:hypothetical protein